jgi:renalase
MDPAFTHFVAAKGTASLCEYLLREADVVRRTVTAVDRESVPSDAEGWRVTAADGSTHSFDAVVLTVPVPQVLQLGGVAEAAVTRGGDLHDRLCAVEYSARWAMAVSLEPKAWDAVHGLGWGARYISKEESSSICYIAADQVKRGSEPTAAVGPTLVVHSGVPWSLKNGAATPQADEADGLRSRIQVSCAVLSPYVSLNPNRNGLLSRRVHCLNMMHSASYVPYLG